MGITTKFMPLGGHIKENEIPWVQVNLEENGTMGGISYAASSSEVSTVNRSDVSYLAYKAFGEGGAQDGYYETCDLTSPTGYVIYYTPIPIKLRSLAYKSVNPNVCFLGGSISNMVRLGGRPEGISIYASNDNENWAHLKTVSEINYSSISGPFYQSETVSVNSGGFYKYIKIQSTGSLDYKGANFYDIEFNATKRA